MRRTATAPAASASSTQPRMSHALRAIVAHTRRGSISGAGSARTGRGRASMDAGVGVASVVANQVVDGEQAEPELHELIGRANRQLVPDDEGRILHVELIAGADAEVAHAVGDGDLAGLLAGPHDEHAAVAAGTDRATGFRYERQHGGRAVDELHARVLHATGDGDRAKELDVDARRIDATGERVD